MGIAAGIAVWQFGQFTLNSCDLPSFASSLVHCAKQTNDSRRSDKYGIIETTWIGRNDYGTTHVANDTVGPAFNSTYPRSCHRLILDNVDVKL